MPSRRFWLWAALRLKNDIKISGEGKTIQPTMALTSQIRSSDATFKLAQRLVESLSERFTLNKDDAWNHVSSMSIEVINRKMRKERRKRNPTSQVKKPRTAFSFFTQRQRPVIQAKNPAAKFGELSRLVSSEWKALTPSQLKEYKELESTDRNRYNVELAAVKEKPVADGSAAPVVEAAPTADAKPAKAPRAKKAAAPASPVDAPATPAAATETKPAKAPKVKTPKAAATPAAAPASSTPAPAAAPAAASSSGSKKAKSTKA